MSYIPNTLISNRFRLNEKLSDNVASGHQIWSVTDTQTGQPLIARIHSDGQIDWFNDNRPAPLSGGTAAPANAGVTAAGPRPVSAPPQRMEPQSGMPSTTPTAKKRRVGWVIVLLILAGASVAGYFNREIVLETYNSWTIEEADSLRLDSMAKPVESKLEPYPAWKPEVVPEVADTNTPVSESSAVAVEQTDGSMELQNLARQKMKSLVEMDPLSDRQAFIETFLSAREQFKKLVASTRYTALCDSLYIIATDRSNQHYRNYRRRNDLDEKAFALEWFRTVQVIRPSPGTNARINELQGTVKKTVPPKKQTYFQKDPELKL